MFYVMETIQKARYLINEKEKNEIFQDIQDRKDCTVIQGDLVPLQAKPAIMSFPRWWAKENERLAVSGKRLCKKCLKVFEFSSRCQCWESEGGQKQNAFSALPEEILRVVHAGIKLFPQVTKQEVENMEILENVNSIPQKYFENNQNLLCVSKELEANI